MHTRTCIEEVGAGVRGAGVVLRRYRANIARIFRPNSCRLRRTARPQPYIHAAALQRAPSDALDLRRVGAVLVGVQLKAEKSTVQSFEHSGWY